jgi:MFS family permease
MLLWGFLGDITGRKWGSRCVALIMLSGCILLTFSPYAPTGYGYFAYFVTAQTWYGFGVGGEYPMAASSAAERSSTTPELRAFRGRQVRRGGVRACFQPPNAASLSLSPFKLHAHLRRHLC